MSYNLFYSPLAQEDLDEIYDYIADELANPQAAEQTIGGILSAVDRLKEFPDMGAHLRVVRHADNDYRFVTFKNFIAFYRHIEENIYIDRVVYKKRDYLRILFRDIDAFPSEESGQPSDPD